MKTSSLELFKPIQTAVTTNQKKIVFRYNSVLCAYSDPVDFDLTTKASILRGSERIPRSFATVIIQTFIAARASSRLTSVNMLDEKATRSG